MKNSPKGNTIAPIKSAIPAIKHVYLGPNQMADSIVGTKLKLIAKNGVLIDKNRDKTIDNVSIKAESIIFFVFDICCI